MSGKENVNTIQNDHENVNIVASEKKLSNEAGAIAARTAVDLSPSCNDQDQCEEDDIEEFDIDPMTGSYIEISLDQELSGIQNNDSSEHKDSQSNRSTENGEKCQSYEKSQKEKKRPSSLVLSKNSGSLNYTEVEAKLNATISEKVVEPWKKIHRSQQTSDSQTTSIDGSPSLSSDEYAIYSPAGHRRNGSDTSGISDLQGTITIDGDMVSFVAEDLQEKIKLSSPVTKWAGESPSYSGSRSSTPSLYKQALQSNFPIIDPGAVADLEVQARKVAVCVDTMLENLSGTLQSISSLTVDYMETYETSVCKTCDSVDTGIKTMYQLMAKCEELSNSVKPLYKISQDIKEIKKTLDHFESIVEYKS